MDPQRDSIFISSMRAFCKAVAVVLGIGLAFIPIILFCLSIGGGAEIESKTTLTILPDANGVRHVQPPNSPVILHININGIIGNRILTWEMIENELLDSQTGVLKNNRVKGILLYIDTPGGAATDSDNIYRLLQRYKARYKVPVYAFADGLCASGGMMVACSADKFYASPSSIIGSIGVVMGPFFNVKETMTMYGVDAVTITEGKNKDMMSPFRAWKPGEDASLKNLGAYYYNRFVDIVANARPGIDRNKLINEYGANVFDPEMAEKIGYIDGQREYVEVLTELLKVSNIDSSKPYQVVTLEPKKTLFSSLALGENKLSALVDFFFAREKPKSAAEPISYLYQVGDSFSY